MQLKILSWNVWIDGYFDEIKGFLRASDADIIGLQEVKDDDPERDVIGFLTSFGYQHVFAPIEKEWGGNICRDGPAVFSKYPILNKQTYVLSNDEKRAAARADIEVNGTVLHIFSTHLVHTHQQPSELQESQVKNLLKVLPSEKTIVMGDFNATPESNAIQKMKEVMIDTDPAALPTWSVYPEGCSKCLPQAVDTRLDYIFASNDLNAHSFEVGESKGSDHLPISVVVEI
jgi:endonuclease/exonuclease/phosphatase family metal-dependent hydrolase